MKTHLLLILIFLLSAATVQAQNKFLPNPDQNLQMVPIGSYVIAMGNTLQANTAGYFNLKTYGLICHLLNNNIKMKWVIRSGKAKDGIDFSGPAEQIQPVYSISSLRDFKAGPLVIYAADTSGVSALINTFYTSNSLTGNDRPNVYRLTTAVLNVDIRHDMVGFRPKVAILNDGGNTAIHRNYMTICGIPSLNYIEGVPGNALLTQCYTFASEPHNDNSSSSTIAAIRKFVEYGGNFLAQCAAIEVYENNVNGRFHTTNGINAINNSVNNTAGIYPNPDLSYTQFEGFSAFERGGTVKNWVAASGSTFRNNEHNHGTGGTLATQNPIGASVAKLTGAALSGGMVFYLGGHSYSSTTKMEEINAMRMYMNAMLTPTAININCETGASTPFPLPVKLISFNADLIKEHKNVDLNWTTITEINSEYFAVEKSIDGVNFQEIGKVVAGGNTDERKDYQFIDNLSDDRTIVFYYRIRMVEQDEKSTFSNTKQVRLNQSKGSSISLVSYPNPVVNEVQITKPFAWTNRKVVYELVNLSGHVIKKLESGSSKQTEVINIKSIASGFYILNATCNGETAQQKIIKQ